MPKHKYTRAEKTAENRRLHEVGMRRCHGPCLEIKSVSAFNRNGSGYASYCRDCSQEYDRRYKEENSDKVRECDRRYREKSPPRREYYLNRFGNRPADLPWPDGPVGYDGAHNRVAAVYGRASWYTCDCGEQAEDWAYQHTAGDRELTAMKYDTRRGAWREVAYSPDPEDYKAMCKSCHTSFDIAHARERAA